MIIAQIGDIVKYNYRIPRIAEVEITAKVLKVNENSVIVDLSAASNLDLFKLDERTDVKHRSYRIIKNTSNLDYDVKVLNWLDEEIKARAEKEAQEKASEEKIEVFEEEGSRLEIIPGSKENYLMLKDLGYSDIKVMSLWNNANPQSKWHNARLNSWKKENDLSSYRKKRNSSIVINSKTSPPIESKRRPLIDIEPLKTEKTNEVLQDAGTSPAKEDNLVSENARLRLEVAELRRQLWIDRTAKLFQMQKELDRIICESNDVTLKDMKDEHALATIVELAEVAQEEQSFKYWKKNKSVNREKLLEELIDVLHFVLSRGLLKGFTYVELDEKTLQIEESVTAQMMKFIQALLATVPDYQYIFETYYGLVKLLDYEWHELVTAYESKNYENITRQNRNY